MSSFERNLRKTREPEIEALVAGYKAGDQTATDALVVYIKKLIKQVLHTKKFPGYHDHLEDLEQECWIDALKNLPKWRPERGTLKNYFFQCFINRAKLYLYRTLQVHRDGLRVWHSPAFVEEWCDNGGGQTREPPEVIDVAPASDILPTELLVSIPSRFAGARESYVLRKVCTAVYLRVFDGTRGKIVADLRRITGLGAKRLKFLIDYSLVAIRLYGLGAECRE